MNILNRYSKSGVIQTGSDDVQLDSPVFEIVNVAIDTVEQKLIVEIMHEVIQGSLTQKHSRTFDVAFANLPSSVKVAGKVFLDAIEAEILELPQYQGSTKL